MAKTVKIINVTTPEHLDAVQERTEKFAKIALSRNHYKDGGQYIAFDEKEKYGFEEVEKKTPEQIEPPNEPIQDELPTVESETSETVEEEPAEETTEEKPAPKKRKRRAKK